ncbi:MAG: ABC transporter permease [Micrococcales bacterium]|nr:ABC transporter permease [Micrococcales bacterium]MCL2667647.1 ABC transporter permease [Micrococcales bacterium]
MTTTAVQPVTVRQVRWTTQFSQVFLRWTRGQLREPWGIGTSLFQPVIWIVLFGAVFSTLKALPAFSDGGYVTFLIPGILMMTVLYSGAWAGQGFIMDMDSGVMASMMAMPLRRTALLAGQLATQTVICLLQAVTVLVIGWLAGARYSGGVVGLLVAVAVALVLCVAFSSVSNAVALITRNGIALIGIAQIIVLPMTFLSSTMMPHDLLPGWVQNVATVNPQTWAVDIGRAALNGNLGSADGLAWKAACLLTVAALLFFWSLRSLRSFQRAQ